MRHWQPEDIIEPTGRPIQARPGTARYKRGELIAQHYGKTLGELVAAAPKHGIKPAVIREALRNAVRKYGTVKPLRPREQDATPKLPPEIAQIRILLDRLEARFLQTELP